PDDPLVAVDAALAAGAPIIQVRAKALTDRALFALAEAVVMRCRVAGATSLVDDRVDIALATGADGVHLGDEDLPVDVARRLLGHEAIIGATARDVAAGRARVAEGADYLGVGPTYATSTKTGLPPALGPEAVGAVAKAVSVPVIAIAGITLERVPEVLAQGVHGIAVVSAVTRADDPGGATADLLAAIEAGP
ncbi:MAG TPA: thiamine phosphate synthase, partial [Actinomycetota bacterium]|nr:thiamine phosphate synthase [Actinomycetota bacterium]